MSLKIQALGVRHNQPQSCDHYFAASYNRAGPPSKKQSIMRTYTLHSITRRTLQPSKLRLHLSTMTSAILPQFSPGEDTSRLMPETTALLESAWSLDDSHQGLLKTFNFPTYAKALVSLSLPPPLTHY